jgi:S-adenosylmethionine:tRNA ribosyltransferase-isomerase
VKTEDFNYYLPEELIAQHPLESRSSSRLMVVHKSTGEIEHKHFTDIIDYLNKGDALVINDSKVIPARIIGEKEDTKAVIELLLLKNIKDDVWECLSKPQKRLHIGTVIIFGNGLLKAKVVNLLNDGITHVELIYDGILMEVLDKLGEMPLPPYIHERLEDKDRYQTVYAKTYGSAAAPTAGLHFTEELLDKIKVKGIEIVHVTLHVGLGTFRPVVEEDILKHDMHSEMYYISEDAANTLNRIKENGGRIFAVGTTSTRVLETNRSKYDKFTPEVTNTNIFIYPGYEFKGIDNLITNFHLPKSTLIMLVSALAGRELILKAYNEAVKDKYRFFSFGDAMLIID